ncbi:MAG: glycosyltransferase [Chlamydiales bacterium]|nr:glycosyltransferase [Chlamydiales bacterium]
MQAAKQMIVIDGRVFSTDAHDRGMGRYVRFIIQTVAAAGFEICLILYKNSRLEKDDPLQALIKKIEFVDIYPDIHCEPEIHTSSHAIEVILRNSKAEAFIDTTPFLLPARLDITVCPVIAIAYDLIPLKHPKEYNLISEGVCSSTYRNGLRRLINADFIIAISSYTKDAISAYLGIEKERIEVIYPCLDEAYLLPHSSVQKTKDFFSIIGGHFSKNPEFALKLFNALTLSKKQNFTLCVPTLHQIKTLEYNFFSLTKELLIQHSLSEEEKISSQASARVAFHLSRDEGFGIPLLEALFLHTRVICCDIPINREILEKSGETYKGMISLLLSLELNEQSISEIESFINLSETDENDLLFKKIRDSFINHWTEEAPLVIQRAVVEAAANHLAFSNEITAKMVCNTPGDFCGVADYAYSIPCGTKKNMLIYTADTSIKKLDALPGVRIKTHLSFPADLDKKTPTIFHFAISERLFFGIELLRKYGSSNDLVILHDHSYLFGLYRAFLNRNYDDFLTAYFIEEDAPFAKQLKNARHLNFDEFNASLKGYSSAWLRRLNIPAISHLTESAQKEHELLSSSTLKIDKKYVDIGIEDRVSFLLFRAAKIWRRQKGLFDTDLLVGVFGSITDNKYIPEIGEAVARACKAVRHRSEGCSKIHLVLCGTVLDRAVFDRAKSHFASEGLDSFFHYEHSLTDEMFDGLIAATDLVISCRRQDRGQLSHIVPRTLSLGKPLLTNSKSGYTMVQNDCLIDEEEFTLNLEKKLLHIAKHPEELKSISSFNRNLFSEKHDVAQFFNHIKTFA